MLTTIVHRKANWDQEIGPDLREVKEWGLGPVVSCQALRAAMDLKEGKLPITPVHYKVVGDTTVYVFGQKQAELLKPNSNRPHRMYAICNHCHKHVPTGRFGQHLKVHDEEKAVLRSYVP